MDEQLVPVRRSRPLRAAPLEALPSPDVGESFPDASAPRWSLPAVSAIADAFLPVDGHGSDHDDFWSESVTAREKRRGLGRLRRSA